MGGGVQDSRRNSGGILSLVRIIENHDRALEYDLLTRTGRTLDEYMSMGAAGKVALLSFIEYLPEDSALMREMDPKDETWKWATIKQTNIILADLFYAFSAVHTKKGRAPYEYPRPNKNNRIGSGAIPVCEFWDWWNAQDEE